MWLIVKDRGWVLVSGLLRRWVPGSFLSASVLITTDVGYLCFMLSIAMPQILQFLSY